MNDGIRRCAGRDGGRRLRREGTTRTMRGLDLLMICEAFQRRNSIADWCASRLIALLSLLVGFFDSRNKPTPSSGWRLSTRTAFEVGAGLVRSCGLDWFAGYWGCILLCRVVWLWFFLLELLHVLENSVRAFSFGVPCGLDIAFIDRFPSRFCFLWGVGNVYPEEVSWFRFTDARVWNGLQLNACLDYQCYSGRPCQDKSSRLFCWFFPSVSSGLCRKGTLCPEEANLGSQIEIGCRVNEFSKTGARIDSFSFYTLLLVNCSFSHTFCNVSLQFFHHLYTLLVCECQHTSSQLILV